MVTGVVRGVKNNAEKRVHVVLIEERSPLRVPTRSREVNAKKRHRHASVGMTGWCSRRAGSGVAGIEEKADSSLRSE
jgi:hypothetical protein